MKIKGFVIVDRKTEELTVDVFYHTSSPKERNFCLNRNEQLRPATIIIEDRPKRRPKK